MQFGHRVDVGRVGPEGDPVAEPLAGQVRRLAAEVGHLEDEPVEADRPPGVADVGHLGQAGAGPQDAPVERHLPGDERLRGRAP